MSDREQLPTRKTDDEGEELFQSIALDLLDEAEPGSIVDELVDSGWEPEEAEELVASLDDDLEGIFEDLDQGLSRREIVEDLVGRDWAPASARRVVKEAQAAIRAFRRAPDDDLIGREAARIGEMMPREMEAWARKKMIYGAFWTGGGVVVTALSFMALGTGGYVLAWGAILYGVVELIRGGHALGKIRSAA